jgi:hypothetical protein
VLEGCPPGAASALRATLLDHSSGPPDGEHLNLVSLSSAYFLLASTMIAALSATILSLLTASRCTYAPGVHRHHGLRPPPAASRPAEEKPLV